MENPVSGAQLYAGKACIMVENKPDQPTPAQLGYGTQSLTIFHDEIDAHYNRVKSTGAKIVEELHETTYGARQFGVEDFDDHHWLFSKHDRDLTPPNGEQPSRNAEVQCISRQKAIV